MGIKTQRSPDLYEGNATLPHPAVQRRNRYGEILSRFANRQKPLAMWHCLVGIEWRVVYLHSVSHSGCAAQGVPFAEGPLNFWNDDPCVYLNDSATAVEKNGVDYNSSPSECSATGGTWVPPGSGYSVDAINGTVVLPKLWQDSADCSAGASQFTGPITPDARGAAFDTTSGVIITALVGGSYGVFVLTTLATAGVSAGLKMGTRGAYYWLHAGSG